MNPTDNHQNNIFEFGAIWLKADFHLHTIQDKEFARIENGNEFAGLFVKRLIEENIGIGVITNHNKFDKKEYKCIQKKAKNENIMILAGTELSVNDGANGIHCLIVFDDKTWLVNGEDYINQFLTAVFEGTANRENENTRCRYDLMTVLSKLDEHRKDGRDSFIIFAHAEQNSGFFEELDGGRIKQLASSEVFKRSVLGLQKMRCTKKFDIYSQWFGGNLPAFVEGSDCKSIESIGKIPYQNEEKNTFIKIGDFNFGALKYALIDKNYRVCSIKPTVLNSYIKSIRFIGGKLDKKAIYLSPGLNNLIGIRGSGKSSILEILRYVLGVKLTSSSADIEYKNDLIEYILGSGGKAVVNIVDKHGVEFRIEKIYGQHEVIFKEEGNEICECSIGAVFDLPIYFGQKDLSNKKEGFEADLLKRLIGDKLGGIGKEIEAKKQEIKNLISDIKKSQYMWNLKDDTEKNIKDSEQKLVYFREKGVEEKLKAQTEFDKDVNVLEQKKEGLKSYINDVDELINNHSSFFTAPLKAVAAINGQIFEEADKAFTEAKAGFGILKNLREESLSALQKFDSAVNLLTGQKNKMAEEFAEIKRKINSDTLNPDVFLSLTRVIDTSRIKLEEINKQIEKERVLKADLFRALNDLNELWLEEFHILNNETNKINNLGGNLSIEIEFKGRKDSFIEGMKNIFRGTGLRETQYQKLSDEFSDFSEIYRDSEKSLNILGNNKAAFDERFNAHLDEVLTFRVEDKVIINYRDKPLKSLSLGQRASALILFLLAQKDNDVLIIDQPEDDLDNQTIYDEVIKEILRLKGEMQFIFATHNANIPVLGDSEKVISCSFENNSCISINEGTIDTPLIQKSIVDIMEGGKEAFDKRKYIYNIWK